MTAMIIDQGAWDALITHARREAARDNRESCGLLSGGIDTPGVLERYDAMVNVADHPRARYEVDADDLMALYQSLEDAGLRPWVMVHSHPTTDATPSPADIRYATNPDLLHLVVSLTTSTPHGWLWKIDSGRRTAEKAQFQVLDLGKWLPAKNLAPTDLTRRMTNP